MENVCAPVVVQVALRKVHATVINHCDLYIDTVDINLKVCMKARFVVL